jgi:hypothetical protein
MATKTAVLFVILSFFVFSSDDDNICLNDRQGLVPKSIVNQQFYSRRLFAALSCSSENGTPALKPDLDGVAVSKAL